METVLAITLAATLIALASIFLLAAVRFGITRGEMRIDSESAQFAAQANRAGNIAIIFFLATTGGAAWLLFNSSPALLPRLHWLIKFLGVLIALALCSYGLVILSLTGRAPDLMINLEHMLSRWLMSIVA